MTWPLVDKQDDGIRPAGEPDQCLYCKSRVGEPHGTDCVVVKKIVRMQYSFEVEIEMPHSWSVESIEFSRNEGSWCASNALEEIKSFIEEKYNGCACSIFQAKYIETVDDTPRRDITS